MPRPIDETPDDSVDRDPVRKSSNASVLIGGGAVAAVMVMIAGVGLAVWQSGRKRAAEEVAQTKPSDQTHRSGGGFDTPSATPGRGRSSEEAVAPRSTNKPTAEATHARLLTQALNGSADARVEAIASLGSLGAAAQSAVPSLIPMLDENEERVRRAASDALQRIGPPSEEDSGCMDTALKSNRKFGRLHALKYFSNQEKASREQLRLIATLVSDRDPGTRTLALEAIAFAGPSAKQEAFPAVLAATLDADPAIAARASMIISGYSPLDAGDSELLVGRLSDTQPKIRLLAVKSLMPLAPDADSAVRWFGPRLGDGSAEVRAAALSALGKWGPMAKALQPRVAELSADANEDVRFTSVWVLGEIGNGPGVVPALGKQLSPETPAKVRDQAIRSLLKLELNDAKSDVPVLLLLLASNDDRTRAAALEKLIRFVPASREALAAVRECTKSRDPAVLYWSMRVAAQYGADAAEIAPRAQEVLIGKAELRVIKDGEGDAATIDNVRVQAAETLSAVAAKPVDLLLKSLDEPLSAPVAAKVCDLIAKRAKDVPASALPRLFLLAERDADLRPRLSSIVGGVGGDEVFRKLAERTYWSSKTLGNGMKVKECKYSLDVQVWAIRTMGLLDPKTLSEAERASLLERMTTIPKTNPDLVCREEAQAAYAKLVAAGLSPKKP
ncbi:MAG: HEAT repeat domain-containing protein [Gemmataceae bacterium]